MSKKFYAGIALATLAACATVEGETRTTAVVQDGFYKGEVYQVRTQTLNGAQGEFERSSVVYRGFSRVCRANSPGDCEKAAVSLIEEIDEAPFIF